MLVAVVVLFALCWLPLHTFFFVLNFTDKQHHPSLTLAYFICHWIAMSNSFVNPIVYGLLNDSFRVSIMVCLCECIKSQLTIFQLCQDVILSTMYLGLISTKHGLKCQVHNAVPSMSRKSK